jgi:Ulp1 family protease
MVLLLLQVPEQPNHCDCGIYLLHFAKTFMKDPHRYVRQICVSDPIFLHGEEPWS